MVRTKTPEEYNKRMIFKSMEAFLEGSKNLAWILGIIDNENALALDLLQTRLPDYGDEGRRDQLRRELESRIGISG